MDKLILTIFLVGFWLFLPVPMMLFNIGGFQEMQVSNITGIGILDSVINFGRIYIHLLTFSIAGVPPFISRIINFLQIITVIVGYFSIRGA